LDADLSSLFNWNTKQVFAYLVADYKTSKYVAHPAPPTCADKQESNSVTFWDRIMNNPEEAKLQIYSGSQKYPFTDITGSFRNFNATYTLRWNVVPWVGIMQWGQSKARYITLPQTGMNP
jgi:signal peptidase complex subunit 3